MIEVFSTHLRQTVVDQNAQRSSWVEHDTPEQLIKFYWAEDQEYRKAKELCELGAEPTEFASEAGDKGYLYIKLMDMCNGQVPPEIEADMTATLAECEELGFDIHSAVFMKVWRNDIKYPLMFSRNGFGYEGSQALSREQYKHLGGDVRFMFAYMMMADSIYSDAESDG